MKKILILVLFFVSLFSYSQRIEVYNVEQNVKEHNPTFVIEKSENFEKMNIHMIENGIKNIFPSYEIEDGKVYKVTNNYKDIFPIKEFVVKNDNISSGNYNTIINFSTNTQSRTDFLTDYVEELDD